MIFVFENLRKSRQKRIKDWERTGQEWLDKKNEGRSYSVYSFRDYERKYPKPITLAKVAGTVLPILGGIGVVALLVTYVVTLPPKKVDPNNPNDCSVVVKKDDKVAIRGGRFDGSEGVVVSQNNDCEVSVKLTKSLWTMKRCKENDEILRVEKSSDITKL